MISFIMMAYNVEDYIEDAIVELQKENEVEWELIIVDDFSNDDTFNISSEYAKNDQRIIVVKNILKGKVTGTNYGYTLTKGDIIKCIDSDDVLKQDFFREYKNIEKHDAHCHNAYITNNNLEIQARYNINPLHYSESYEYVLTNLISFPKWSWSFSRDLANKIFPMPDNLPFEDVWISLVIKKYAKSIFVIEKPVYLYRQHENQTFGGIINYNFDKVSFRAKRLIKLIDILESEQNYLFGNIKEPFTIMKEYLYLNISHASILKILNSKISLKNKIKLILILHFPNIATFITKLKWKLDKK